MTDIELIDALHQKYFKDETTQYIHVSDYHNNAEPNFYISAGWKYGKYRITLGSDNGEILIFATDYEHKKVEQIFKTYFE